MNDTVMTYDFQIAGLMIRNTPPFPITITPESQPFLSSPSGCRPDITFTFQAVSCLADPSAAGNWTENRFHGTDSGLQAVWFRPRPGEKPYALVQHETNALHCQYLRGAEHRMNLSRNLTDLMSLEIPLLSHNGFLLHAAFVRWQEKGILFSGPSGVGKSTQADLWKTHLSGDILNGDRAALRRMEDGWRGWGLPYAGTSGIYRNESAPVTAIVMLEQAPVNRVRRLSPGEAFRSLYPQVTIHRWDSDFTKQVSDLMLELIEAIPVYLLSCRPDTQAAELLHETLMKGE